MKFVAVMRRDGTFDMTGFHDQAPHHEIYMIAWRRKQTGYRFTRPKVKGSRGCLLLWLGNTGAFQTLNDIDGEAIMLSRFRIYLRVIEFVKQSR